MKPGKPSLRSLTFRLSKYEKSNQLYEGERNEYSDVITSLTINYRSMGNYD